MKNADTEVKQRRKWLITFNNPVDHGFPHEKIKEVLSKVRGNLYWCMCDEIGGETACYHTHLFIYRTSPFTFDQIKKMFPPAHLDKCFGSNQENRDYVRKEGKWKDSEKELTNLKDTFEESGECPEEHQGARNDLTVLYDMIKDGMSNFQILEENPNYMKQLDKIDKCREIMRYEEFKNKVRNMQVEYWYGKTGSGKTSGILERYGYENVYRVTDLRNPWDGYRGQDVVLFEEFSGEIDITRMLIWLDIYPLELPCRYNNKTACYTKVFMTSNKPLDRLYWHIQREDPEVWKAFLRRISCVKEFGDKGIISYANMEDYLARYRFGSSSGQGDEFIQLSLEEAKQLEEDFGFG